MREAKFKFLMENGEITKPYYLRELIDSDSYINIECEYSSKIKKELQYTGLKDKNGVELYDGYILKNKANEIFVVYFDKGCFFIHPVWLNDDKNDLPLYMIKTIPEKIGNIYENSELLNES